MKGFLTFTQTNGMEVCIPMSRILFVTEADAVSDAGKLATVWVEGHANPIRSAETYENTKLNLERSQE
jgi:hypothetical protein